MKNTNQITEADVIAFLSSKLQKLKGIHMDYLCIHIHADPLTGEVNQKWVSAQASDHIERKAGHANTVDEAIQALSEKLVCDHDWKNEDRSFDHEFGTERLVVDVCENCNETRNSEENHDAEATQ